jgi:signal transduction histidine kinase
MKESSGDRIGAERTADQWRLNLARRLHEGPQQQLVDIIIQLSRADQTWTERPQESRQFMELAAVEAQRALEGIRDLVKDIYPMILATRGVGPALHSLALRLPFPLELDVPSNVVSPGLDDTVYFLCYHALIDVPSHDEVAAARLAIVSTGKRLVIEIKFEGNGTASGTMRAWLDPLHHRLAAREGLVEVKVESNRNLLLTIEIPVAG